ncbi:MAG: type II secretion system protein N [Acidobacteriota bacterium]|jgi:type II secretory pathway component PulC
MPNRKYIIITLLAVLLLGSLIFITAKIYWTPTEKISPIGDSKPETNARIDTQAAPAGAELPSPGTPPADAESPRGSSFSKITNLLNTSNRKQVFGSYQVKGIIVNDAAPGSSSATIEDLSNNTSRIYSLNDTLSDNSRLVDIKQDYVVLQKNGVRKRLYIQYYRGNRSRTRGFASGNDSNGYERISDNEFNLNPYRVFRGDTDTVLDFTMKVSNRDGRMNGIKISDISDDSLARKLGLKENDVLLSVNKESVDSILNGINACMNAYNSDDLQLEILRGDQVISLNYHLFWEGQGSWTPSDVLSSKAVSSLIRNDFFSNIF